MQTRQPEQVEMGSKTEALLANPEVHTKLHHKHKLNKRLLGLALCVIAVLVVAAIVVLAIYAAREPAKGVADKELLVTYRTYGGMFVEEQITVSETEVVINVFNNMAAVYDFENIFCVFNIYYHRPKLDYEFVLLGIFRIIDPEYDGKYDHHNEITIAYNVNLVVERYTNVATSKRTGCFSRPLNHGIQLPSKVLERYTYNAPIRLKAASTKVPIKKFTYTPRVEEIGIRSSDTVKKVCDDTSIYLMKNDTYTLPVCSSPVHSMVCFEHQLYKCITVCYHGDYCHSDTRDGHVIIKTEQWYCKEGCADNDSQLYC